jgi:hypothetical protein
MKNNMVCVKNEEDMKKFFVQECINSDDDYPIEASSKDEAIVIAEMYLDSIEEVALDKNKQSFDFDAWNGSHTTLYTKSGDICLILSSK